jgi:hypothetical protein
METDPYLDKYINQIKVTINDDEVEELRKGMIMLKQVKPSTALKQLALIGVMKMYQDEKMIGFLNKNMRLNEKNGIMDISREVDNSLRKVPKI